jgi:ketosteroid isomerase-like protein
MPQVIRDGFARWNRGDHRFDPETMHPDIEIRSIAGLLTGKTYEGAEGVEQWARDIYESFDEWTIEVTEFEQPSPTRVLAIGSTHFRGRESGVVIDEPCAWIIDHDQGLVTRFEVFLNRVEEARELASR